jgi:hypothetical protein
LRCALRLVVRAAAAAALLLGLPARAAPTQFHFLADVDATDFGLAASQPIIVLFTYDPLATPIVGSSGMPPTRTVYGPVDGALYVALDVVEIHGQVSIDDGGGYDGFAFYAANDVVDTSVAGSLQGMALHRFSLDLLDQTDLLMFDSTDLPPSAAFQDQASQVSVEFGDSLDQATVRSDWLLPGDAGEFDFDSPEPGSAAAGQVALAALGLLASRSRRRAQPRAAAEGAPLPPGSRTGTAGRREPYGASLPQSKGTPASRSAPMGASHGRSSGSTSRSQSSRRSSARPGFTHTVRPSRAIAATHSGVATWTCSSRSPGRTPAAS